MALIVGDTGNYTLHGRIFMGWHCRLCEPIMHVNCARPGSDVPRLNSFLLPVYLVTLMRLPLLIILLCGALWYYFIEGRRMNETHVREAYALYWDAFHDDKRGTICNMFDKRFTATVRTMTPAGPVEETATKENACEGTKKFFDLKAEMEEKTGQELFINTEYTIDSIELASDRKSAVVEVSSEIRMGTERMLLMKINGTQTDTVIRDAGKIKFLSSDADISFY
jgi:hypothetical protein